ncbi:MAG: hypothetical protein EXR79_07340 [Myxococcales bacterium]|nr:hypothetical protein [Myxococcales bacterium]
MGPARTRAQGLPVPFEALARPADPTARSSYDAGLGTERRRLGAFYTPPDVARRLTELVLAPLVTRALAATEPALALAHLTVWDPACGDGVWLCAALEILASAWAHVHQCPLALARSTVAQHSLWGTDIDPGAVDLARLALARHADPAAPPLAELADHIVCGDGLLDPAPATFACVLGNPPFLGQLKGPTAHDRARRDRLRARFGSAVNAYTDASALFLLAALDAVPDGGVVCLIQPRSLLATRDAAPVRAATLARAVLTGLWLGGRDVFDAQVDVIAPVLTRTALGTGDPDHPADVPRWRGRGLEWMEPADARGIAQRPTWASLGAEPSDLPAIHCQGSRPLAWCCTATADFRDQYYGLRGCLVEDAAVPANVRDRFPPLVTVGLIDLARCRWGERATRVHGQVWQAPRVDRDRVEAHTKLGPWLAQRLVPKILLATQTRVLEPWVDAAGVAVPSVPCLTIVPRDPAALWQVAAALASPVLTALAVRDFGGTALSSRAIKLAAAHVQALPAPSDGSAWHDGTAALQAAQQAEDDTDRLRALTEMGRAMTASYGIQGDSAATLLAWWWQRQSVVPRRS